MSGALIAGCFWVIAASVTAMLPMRRQMLPGLGLVGAAPLLLIWIGVSHGWLWAAMGLLAFVSMFRRPLAYFARKAMS